MNGPSSQSAVDVQFCIKVDGEGCVGEKVLARSFESYKGFLHSHPRLNGEIHMAASDGQTARYGDELGPAVQDLCFGSVRNLLAGKTVEIEPSSYEGVLRLSPHGDTVVVSGDFTETAVFSRPSLARALYGCGERFLQLLKRLDGEDHQTIASLGDLASQAALALEAAGA